MYHSTGVLGKLGTLTLLLHHTQVSYIRAIVLLLDYLRTGVYSDYAARDSTTVASVAVPEMLVLGTVILHR